MNLKKKRPSKSKPIPKANEEYLKRLAERVNAAEILEKISNLIRTEMASAYEWTSRSAEASL